MDQVRGMVATVRKAGMPICGSSHSISPRPGEHETAYQNESGRGGKGGDGSDERRDKEREEEEDAGDDGGDAGAATCGDSAEDSM